MEFNFISIKSGGSATILDCQEKPRFICFKERMCAKKYAKYISEHKAMFGTWPEVNLSVPLIEVRLAHNHIQTEASGFMQMLDITHKTHEDLDNMSIMTGVNYFYCHKFDYQDLLSISISGQEIDGFLNDLMYRENLN